MRRRDVLKILLAAPAATFSWTEAEAAQAAVKTRAAEQFREHLERIQGWVKGAAPYWLGGKVSFLDAYAFTLLRWGGYAGIDPESLPAYKAYIEGVVQAPPVAAALARERIALDTYKKAA